MMRTAESRDRCEDDGRRHPSDLTDAEWATIAPMMPVYGTLTADLREIVNACSYLEKAGCPLRFLPEEFGPWQTVRSWHDRFRADDVWADIAAGLTRAERARRGRDPEPSMAIMDSQSVAATPVTAADVHDTAAAELPDRAAAAGWRPQRVEADGLYTGEHMRRAAKPLGVEREVSTRDRNAKGFRPMPLRWRIEGTFGTLTNRHHRLTRNLERSAVGAEDAVTIANRHRLVRSVNSREETNGLSHDLHSRHARFARPLHPCGTGGGSLQAIDDGGSARNTSHHRSEQPD